jgi:hypothetical protein
VEYLGDIERLAGRDACQCQEIGAELAVGDVQTRAPIFLSPVDARVS